MQKIFVTLALGISLTASLAGMESQKRNKYLSIDLRIKKARLEQATKQRQQDLQLNLKVKKVKEKLAVQYLKKYEANLKELDPVKLWNGRIYLIRAQIKTDNYGLFCRAYEISRNGKPYVDSSRTLELPKKYRQAFAADPRVLIVKCNDGSGDPIKALANHLQLKLNK